MFPEGFESLNVEDHILVARVNLCGAAIAVVVFAFLLESFDWPGRTLALVLAAGFVYLARQMDWICRRLEPPRSERREEAESADPFVAPFS